MKRSHHQLIDTNRLYASYAIPNADGTLKSCADIAEEFNLKVDRVERICLREGWVKRRTDAGKKALLRFEETQEAENAKILGNLYTQMKRLSQISESYIDLIEDGFKEDDKVNGRRVVLVRGKEFREIVEAFTRINNLIRVQAGIPTEITKGEMTTKNVNLNFDMEEASKIDRFLTGDHETIEAPAQNSDAN